MLMSVIRSSFLSVYSYGSLFNARGNIHVVKSIFVNVLRRSLYWRSYSVRSSRLSSLSLCSGASLWRSSTSCATSLWRWWASAIYAPSRRWTSEDTATRRSVFLLSFLLKDTDELKRRVMQIKAASDFSALSGCQKARPRRPCTSRQKTARRNCRLFTSL